MIEISNELDRKEDRVKALEHIKEEVFKAHLQIYNWELGLTHPKHKEECQALIEMTEYSIKARIQDAQSFLYDYSDDWSDLNFQDYSLDNNEIKE